MRGFGMRAMPQPLIFEITNQQFARKSHCGVLEFSGPDQRGAYLPRWMMDNLHLEDGARVRLQLRRLPKVRFVQFQPLEYAFTRIPDPKRTLEYALRSFTALTVGDTIQIKHGVNTYLVNITEMKPEKAGCVVDTSVSVDFIPPVEEAPEPKTSAEIHVDDPVVGEVEPDSAVYFHIKVLDPEAALEFRVSPIDGAGDPDLYLSGRHQFPSLAQHEWRSLSTSTEDRVLVEPDDATFPGEGGLLHVAVTGYGDDVTRFELVVSETAPASLKKAKMSRLKTDEPLPDGAKVCDNCLRPIPPAQMTMHSLRCARQNWRCPDCNMVMHRAERETHTHCSICGKGMHERELEKHERLLHTTVPCACGQELDPRDMAQHQAEDCVLRLVPCAWCAVQIPLREKEEHEAYCSGKSVPCDQCGKMVQRRRMEIHMAVDHNVNPSQDLSGSLLAASPSGEDPLLQAAIAASVSASASPAPEPVAHAEPARVTASTLSPADAALEQALQQSRQAHEDELLQAVIAASLQDSGTPPVPAPVEPQPSVVDDAMLAAALAAADLDDPDELSRAFSDEATYADDWSD